MCFKLTCLFLGHFPSSGLLVWLWYEWILWSLNASCCAMFNECPWEACCILKRNSRAMGPGKSGRAGRSVGRGDWCQDAIVWEEKVVTEFWKPTGQHPQKSSSTLRATAQVHLTLILCSWENTGQIPGWTAENLLGLLSLWLWHQFEGGRTSKLLLNLRHCLLMLLPA